jgi:hypothetical protein
MTNNGKLCKQNWSWPNLTYYLTFADRLCGLVVRVPGYRSRDPGFDSRVLPDFLRNSVSGTGSTQPREYLEEIVAAPV